MDYSNPLLISLRRVGQRLHILRPVVRLWRRMRGFAYEEAFDNYVVARITPGSVVWDIGANVGFFTEKFSLAVGGAGKVIAFDPSPGCVSTLRERFARNDTVIVEPVGLADTVGSADFSVSASTDPTGGLGVRTNHDNVVKVNVTTGDIYAKEHASSTPNYIKIDVEGYEYEVINGMSGLLSDEKLKAIFIEMHFLELAKRNLGYAPANIVNTLKSKGFAIRWIDPSHLAAERGL